MLVLRIIYLSFNCNYSINFLLDCTFIYIYIYIYIYIQGVTGGKDQTSGGCSLC